MTRVELTVQQCRALGEYLRNRVDRGMGFGYDEIELLVLSCRALLAVSDVPVVCERPTSPPPEPVKSAAPSAAPRSGAAEAAELKRATLARLEAYRLRAGLVSLTPLAELCDEVDGKAVTPEMLGRMLRRERFPVAVWRSVAAALDKMDKKDGGAKNED